MQKQQHLEKQVAETEAVVKACQGMIARIKTEFNVANLAVVNAKKVRQANALEAAMNNSAATAAIRHARSEQHNAEQTIADLKMIALPAAEEHLANAEREAKTARQNLARFNAEALMRKRIEVAGELDRVIADFARLRAEYEEATKFSTCPTSCRGACMG